MKSLLHDSTCRCALCRLQALKRSKAVKDAEKRETVREIGKENVEELMRKRGVDNPEDLD